MDFFDEAMDSAHSVEEWFVPLSRKTYIQEATTELLAFGFQEDIPLIIQMVENPKFDLPGIDIFHGSTDCELMISSTSFGAWGHDQG